jgi:hypothetical protein
VIGDMQFDTIATKEGPCSRISVKVSGYPRLRDALEDFVVLDDSDECGVLDDVTALATLMSLITNVLNDFEVCVMLDDYDVLDDFDVIENFDVLMI